MARELGIGDARYRRCVIPPQRLADKSQHGMDRAVAFLSQFVLCVLAADADLKRTGFQKMALLFGPNPTFLAADGLKLTEW